MMNNENLDDELTKIKREIMEIKERSDNAKKVLIHHLFIKYHPELMSYAPYNDCVSLANEYLNLKIKEINLIKEIENKEK